MEKKLKLKKMLMAASVMMLVCGCGSSDTSTSAVDVQSYDGYSKNELNAGAASDYVWEDESWDDDAGYAMVDEESAGTNDSSQEMISKRIYTANVRIETTDYNESVDTLNQLVAACHGFIESEDVQFRTHYSSVSEASENFLYGSYKIRIPTADYDSFFQQMKGLGNVVSSSRNTENITADYMQLENDQEYLKIKKEKLEAMLEKAETLDEMLKLESYILDVDWEMQNNSAQLARMDLDVDMSTIYLSLDEVERYTDVESSEWSQLGTAMKDTWYYYGQFMARFLRGLVYLFPYLLTWALVLFVLYRLVKKIRSKRKPQIGQPLMKKNPVRTPEKKPDLPGKKDVSSDE